MALPVGIDVAVVTFGQAVSYSGRTTSARLVVKPSARLVYNGVPILDFPESSVAGAGQPGQMFLPVCDQSGFKATQNGVVVEFTGWFYTGTLTWTEDLTKETRQVTKTFQVLTGQSTIDFDDLPDTVDALPVTAPVAGVTSFLGKTGEITEADLSDLELGGGLTEEVADTRYAPLWQASTEYAINAPVLLPNGKPAIRTAAGTSRAQFDATELALWTVTAAALPVAGTVIANGSSISFGDYPIRLGVRLQEYTEMAQNVVKVAFGGRTTQGMKENMAAALETYRPSHVVIEASINDARKDLAIPSATTIANLRKMVGMCRVRGAIPVLLTSTPINYTQYNQPTQYDATSVTKQQATNALVRTLATEMKVLLVDLYTIFEPLTNYLTDGIHLNATGNDNMGWAIAAAITGNPNPIVAPPAVTTLVTDTFTRADSDVTLGTTSDGTEVWIADVGTWGIKGNAARMATGANGFAAVDVGRSDGTVQATLSPTGVQGIGVTLGRVDGSNNLLVGLYEGLDQVYLFKRDGGALSSLTAVSLTINSGTNYVVAAKLDAGVLKAWIDGVQVLNFPLSTADAAKYAPGTGYGLFVSGTSGIGLADEFKVLVPS